MRFKCPNCGNQSFINAIEIEVDGEGAQRRIHGLRCGECGRPVASYDISEFRKSEFGK